MFVSLFRPLRVVPNSLDPSLHGLDALCIPHLFANCLSAHASPSLTSFAEALIEGDIEIGDDQGDTSLQNLVGDGADSIVRAWTDSARILDKLTTLEPFLRGKLRDAVRRTLGILPLPAENGDGSGGSISILQRMRDAQRINACRAIEHQSDLETQSEDEDAHARTAKLLFEVSERSQMAGFQGMSPEQLQSCESPRRRLIEEGSMEEAPIQKVSRAICASTSQVSECSSQEKVEKGILRARADPGLVSLQTPLLSSMGTKDRRLGVADDRPSSSFSDVSHIASLPFLSSHPSYATSQDGDSPLTDLQNIHLTRMGTERRYIRSHSRSQSRSSSRSQSPLIRIFPSSAHMHFPNTATKRCKVDDSLDIHCKTDVVLVPPEEADSPQALVGLEAIQVGKSTNAARETGSTGERGLGVDGEYHRAQRRALRARSRAIEEKLRHALPMHAR
jgi:hypothetical protein